MILFQNQIFGGNHDQSRRGVDAILKVGGRCGGDAVNRGLDLRNGRRTHLIGSNAEVDQIKKCLRIRGFLPSNR